MRTLPFFKLFDYCLIGWNHNFANIYDQLDIQNKTCLHVTDDGMVPYYSSVHKHSAITSIDTLYRGTHFTDLGGLQKVSASTSLSMVGKELVILGTVAVSVVIPVLLVPNLLLATLLSIIMVSVNSNFIYGFFDSNSCNVNQDKSFLDTWQEKISLPVEGDCIVKQR